MLTEADVGCWLLKTATPPQQILAGWQPGQTRRLTRCLHPSYRLGLMAPGQRCVLWLSGRRQPGLHALGRVVALAGRTDAPTPDQPCAEVDLCLLPAPVAREEVAHDPRLARAEVLRMPMGSNPSYLSPQELDALLGHLDDDSLAAGGWR